MSIQKAKEVIRIEAQAIQALISHVDEHFQKAVDMLLNCKGRVIITGMGKSGIIAQKIASTLTSTGSAALFLHPAEGLHGDLGAVLKDDIVICISKSGNTEEILRLIPLFRRQGVPIISILGNIDSMIAKQSDVVLNVRVKEEACPYDLVPTSSTTAALVMGDALAMALFQERGLSAEDFAQLHPGGDIGKRFLFYVDDVMRTGEDVATVEEETPLSRAVLEITSKRLGATCVLNREKQLVGIITDGDLRRLVEHKHDIWDLKAKDVMHQNPICVQSGVLVAEALHVMEAHSVNQLIITDQEKKPVGMVHLHDLLKAGFA
ncbi:KpsF/GutQ family sugar-phosphate isomerase [bacterium]|nr:KpsF/GutQ family sugar-phosphate isomerase [bacterium]